MTNITKKEGYNQVCVWPGTLMNKENSDATESDIEKFDKFFMDNYGTRVQFLERIMTLPDKGDTTGESGNRSDVFFAVHEDDITKFAIPRLKMGIRWLEDVVSDINRYHLNPIYPARVMEYKCWEAESSEVDADDPDIDVMASLMTKLQEQKSKNMNDFASEQNSEE